MKAFTAHTRFSIKNEAKFNRFMSDRVTFWAARLKDRNSPLNPVEMALGEAIERGLVESAIVIDYQPDDFEKSQAVFRSTYQGPEAFRAMFNEEALVC